MPIQDAVRIFQKYGVDIVDMSLDQIHKLRNALLRKYHPDAGGTIAIAQEINAAFDLLRNRSRGLSKPVSPPRRQSERAPQPNQWAWAGHSGPGAPNSNISRSDFTDTNFIKKSMWELSGKADEEWIVYGYDGLLFTNTVVVYGTPKIFYYMAVAMIDLQTKGRIRLPCRAVLVRAGVSRELYLIYADGKHHDQDPVKFVLDPVDANRVNDSKLMRKLPDLLDHLDDAASSDHNLVLSE
jgi:hypothetical protein